MCTSPSLLKAAAVHHPLAQSIWHARHTRIATPCHTAGHQSSFSQTPCLLAMIRPCDETHLGRHSLWAQIEE